MDLNKQELFTFLSKTLTESVKHQKELVVTDRMQVLCMPAQQDTHLLAPCSHEEADSRMMLHIQHAAQHGHHQNILVRTVDTDVVVLAEVQIWLAFGTVKNFQYLAAHKIAAYLGLEKSLALPMFHALTGCDTVSAFVGHGKKTAWAVWNSFSDLTSALLKLAHAPYVIQEQCLHTIERFVILVYDRTSTSTEVNKARKKLFAKTSSVRRISPQHTLLWSNM